MNDPRQIGAFDPNEYVRPNDGWVCGGAADGLPCPRGPTADGGCGAVCTPFREGNRFYCANPSLLAGACDDGPLTDGTCGQIPAECAPVRRGDQYLCTRGSCPSGPNPDGTCSRVLYVCRPLRTIMARRRMVSLSAFAVALAVVAFLLGGPSPRAAVSPGPVASSHLAIADNCAACHEQGDGTVADWVEAAWTESSLASQSALCLNCHEHLSSHAVNPHSMPPDELRQLTEKAAAGNGGPIMARFVQSTLTPPSELACAACHQEHHGVDHDLTLLADQQCQVCHRNTFHRFDKGHPDFSAYPFDRRPRIHFDHATHYRVHFGNYKRIMPTGRPPGDEEGIAGVSSQSCMNCHQQDLSGAFMEVRGYDAMCASCHEGQIAEDDPAVVPPIPVFSLAPLVDNGATPPGPNRELSLPPIMQLLLNTDDELGDAAVNESLQSVELSAGEEARTELLQATRRLVTDLRDDPTQTVNDRLRNALDELEAENAMAVAATFRTVGFQDALREFGAAVDALVPDASAADAVQDSAAATAPARPVSHGDWSFNPGSATLAYAPHGHADTFARAWMDLAVSLGRPEVLGSTVEHVRQEAPGRSLDRLLRYFGQTTAAGRCAKCHTIDSTGGEQLSVNWHALMPSRPQGFTRFSHGPHIVMLAGGEACANCHVLDDKLDFSSPAYRQSGGLVSTQVSSPACAGMQQLSSIQTCVACHRQGGASQRCTTCHNYHVAPAHPVQ